jgi:hypothetical protein
MACYLVKHRDNFTFTLQVLAIVDSRAEVPLTSADTCDQFTVTNHNADTVPLGPVIILSVFGSNFHYC